MQGAQIKYHCHPPSQPASLPRTFVTYQPPYPISLSIYPKYLGVTIEDDLSWTKHIDITTRKANQTFGFPKRNIRVHNKAIKSVAYKTLVRLQLDYTSTIWYSYTTTDVNKVEAVQRRAPRWATRDYRYTSSVTVILKDLNWGLLDQRCIDSRLMMMYKVTYDLVAIAASLYLVRNTRASRHIPSLAYRQIQTLKDYYRFTFFPRTIIHWNALPANIRTLPTLAQFSSAVCKVIHVFRKFQPLVLSKLTLLLALFKLILPPFLSLCFN